MHDPIAGYVAIALLGSLGCVPLSATSLPVAHGTLALGPGGLTAGGQLQITVDAWARLSGATGDLTLQSKGAKDVPSLIVEVLDRGVPAGAPVDLTFVVDTTGSMGDDIDAVKADMQAIQAHLQARNPDHRIGVVAYRDRGDIYESQLMQPMTGDDAAARAAIGALEVGGGGDLREHVYAGITTALGDQAWRPGVSQHIILMGDAPPHDDYADDPRTFASVDQAARRATLAVRIHTIGVQCDLLCQALIGVGL